MARKDGKAKVETQNSKVGEGSWELGIRNLEIGIRNEMQNAKNAEPTFFLHSAPKGRNICSTGCNPVRNGDVF